VAAVGPPPVHFRDRQEDDLGQLVAIARRVRSADRYPAYLPDNDFQRFLTEPEPRAAWVAVEDRRIVGHVAINDETSPGATQVVRDAGITEPVAYIARLLVDPSVRRTGIGRDLLAHALAAAVADGLVPVLDVVADARKAISLYESTGWVRLGSAELALPDGTSITELVYRGPDPA
jgi:GNAT superfamily N-acetyltransferase